MVGCGQAMDQGAQYLTDGKRWLGLLLGGC